MNKIRQLFWKENLAIFEKSKQSNSGGSCSGHLGAAATVADPSRTNKASKHDEQRIEELAKNMKLLSIL